MRGFEGNAARGQLEVDLSEEMCGIQEFTGCI